MHFGIDYGSKKAGTTAICFDVGNKLYVELSEKNKDADLFIKHQIEKHRPNLVFLDAPLSLPLAYTKGGDNFHFRECDSQLQAMSPMFLGGLTARAMKLKHECNVEILETYPKAYVHNVLHAPPSYNKKSKDCLTFLNLLKESLPFQLKANIKNWHEIDAIICWMSGYRYTNNEHKSFGLLSEGLIII